MSASFLFDYLRYNQWANALLLDYCAIQLPDNWETSVPGSFNSISQIWLHVYDAQHLWLERLKGNSLAHFPSKTLENPLPIQIQDLVLGSAQALIMWALKQEQNLEDQIIAYQNLQKQTFRQSIAEIVMHVCNHSTFHRGQVVTALRFLQPGIKIPETDYIWYKQDE